LVFLLAVYTVLGVAALVHFICSFVVCLVPLAYIFTSCSCCCMCLLVCWPGNLLLLIWRLATEIPFAGLDVFLAGVVAPSLSCLYMDSLLQG
jgi:hypothetical protein